MPRYAYIPYKPVYENLLSNIDIGEFHDQKVIEVDSTKITLAEQTLIKIELKENYYCYACDSKMGLRRQKGRHPHFFHTSARECFEAESLAHAQIKKNLYERFKARGYSVMFERSFLSNNRQVRTDVAVLQESDILAIEVQASPSIQRSTINERTNIYSSEGIPTAWVIVLDSFFCEGNFTSTKEQVLVKHEDGSSSYQEKLLPYETPTPFRIIVEIPKSFTFILEAYKYVIAVNHDGHFFVIRRVDVTGDALEIFRIEQSQVVDSLLATEIIKMDYDLETKTNEKQNYELEHNAGKHLDDTVKPYEWEKILDRYSIDFKKAFEEEQQQLQNEKALNITKVIEETKRREEIHAKKNLIMDGINEELVDLMKRRDTILEYIKEMEQELLRKYTQIETEIKRNKWEEELKIKKEKEIKRVELELLKKSEREAIRRTKEKERIEQERRRKIEIKAMEEKRDDIINNLLEKAKTYLKTMSFEDMNSQDLRILKNELIEDFKDLYISEDELIDPFMIRMEQWSR